MDKPIQIVIEETKTKFNTEIVKIINESGLPMCCINPLLKNVYESCLDLERQQLETAKANYKKKLQTEQNNELVDVSE